MAPAATAACIAMPAESEKHLLASGETVFALIAAGCYNYR